MDTVKYLYQFTQTKVTENILKIVSYRAEKVTNFLLSLQEVRNLFILFYTVKISGVSMSISVNTTVLIILYYVISSNFN